MIGIKIEVSYAGPNKEVLIINGTGYIDTTTAPEIDRVIDEQLSLGLYKIIVDLKDINYISSAGWGVFVSNLSVIRANYGDIVLVNMTPDVHNVYELMEFSSILRSFDSLDLAISFFLGVKVKKIQDDTAKTKALIASDKQRVVDSTASPKREKEVSVSPASKAGKSYTPEVLSLTHTDLGRKILKVVLDNPYFTVKDISKALKTPQYGGKRGRRLAIKRELKFMDLMDKRKRFEFAVRNRP